MALINCPECKKEISSLVENCPHCGFPLKREETEKKSKDNVLQIGDTVINIDEITVAGQFGYTEAYKKRVNLIVLIIGAIISCLLGIIGKNISGVVFGAIISGAAYFIINISYASSAIVGTTGQSKLGTTGYARSIKKIIEQLNSRLVNGVRVASSDDKNYWIYIINPARVANAKTDFDPHRIFSVVSSFSFVIAVVVWFIGGITMRNSNIATYVFIIFIVSFILAILFGKNSIEITSVGGEKTKLFMSKKALSMVKQQIINGIRKSGE